MIGFGLGENRRRLNERRSAECSALKDPAAVQFLHGEVSSVMKFSRNHRGTEPKTKQLLER
jgi:hypothetical protein